MGQDPGSKSETIGKQGPRGPIPGFQPRVFCRNRPFGFSHEIQVCLKIRLA
jgi:hypothetical protein